MTKHLLLLPLVLVLVAVGQDAPPDAKTVRARAQKLLNDGNPKEAYPLFEQLVLDPQANTRLAGNDLNQAMSCLQRLNRVKETDALREKAIAVHKQSWRFLFAAAQSYRNANKYGYIIAGEFERGQHRGGGKYVNSMARDRVRALQLLVEAIKLADHTKDKGALANVYNYLAQSLLYDRGHNDAWRLQYLTDLSELPDYDEGYSYHSGRSSGAPVDPDGDPIYHAIPKSFEDAATDGERWRWCLVQAMELNPALVSQMRYQFAQFLKQQFGVQTMAYYRYLFNKTPDEGDESGPYALHTLDEDETIARLATGVKRFRIPEEFNYIRILQDQVKTGVNYAQNACNDLAGLFANRRQYPRAVEYWKLSIEKFGPGHKNFKQKNIEQIVKNWGRFEPVRAQPAGKGATVEYRFRNGHKVNFTAHALKVDKLLADVKDYLKSNPKQLDWQKINLQQIGYRLVQANQKQYLDKQVADWALKLKPRKAHFDKRITVDTPLKKAGAYLLTARMDDGNTTHIIIWLNDTVILRKNLDKKILYFVGDARTGRPIAKANLAFFGYRQERVKVKLPAGRRYNVVTSEFAEFTSVDGQSVPAQDDLLRNFNWLVTATTDAGRLAYLGFSGVWYGRHHDAQYNQTKTFMITDRPVYRPNQPVKFKFWMRKAQYDQEDVSQFANRSYTVRINNPKNEKVFEKRFKTDAYGGLDGEFPLPEDATLGVYQLMVVGMGGGNFRVEEYKKPEFEVSVKAPTEPVMLGEKIIATIDARYYFGAPVTKARVKYKVLRSSHSQNWYPDAPWDWYYGPGYWWFAYDYEWYPGWYRWGCFRPSPWWWPQRQSPPEVVAENEVEIGEDGTVKIEIDTSFAKDAHPDLDHRYEITAEVVDQSRRTIVGKGQILVARRPFKVYAWVDRGHYRVGDTVRANFSAQTLDNKPVQGKGDLVLYRVTYKKGEPVEKAVEEWKLDTNDEGRSQVQVKAGRSGQYRLSYTLTDAADHEIEGAYVFTVMGKGENAAGFRFNEVELVTDKREYAPGDKVQLRINTAQKDSTVLLFVRPSNSVYLDPVTLRLDGKTALRQVGISKKDMPNFFVEAVTIHNGKIHTEVREIIVPPEKRVLNVDVLPSAEKYKPGEEAKVRVKLTDFFGEPFVGTLAMSIYDKSVEYISGGSNVKEIREFFWKWRRRHNPQSQHNLMRHFNTVYPKNSIGMSNLGIFGDIMMADNDLQKDKKGAGKGERSRSVRKMAHAPAPPSAARANGMLSASLNESAAGFGMEAAAPMESRDRAAGGEREGQAGGGTPLVEATVRTKFADTAFWAATVDTDAEGIAEIDLTMPENLTTWKIKTWAMGHGTKVGEGTAEVLTTKNLVLRLQAPRFFVEKDEVVLSANVHNYLDTKKRIKVSLVVNDMIAPITALKNNQLERWIEIEAGGEQRVDWRIKVVKEGEAMVRMLALTDEESDAVEMTFPAFVHGMLKTDSFSGGIRPDGDRAVITFSVPEARRIAESRLEIRYSPSLAVAMVDALPYMVEYPYGCTEQTLNRFLPTVLTQKILMDMGLDLAAIKEKRTNLNAQEIGEDTERAKQWKRWKRNPVFDAETVDDMVKKGVKALTSMQLGDGGWGWFSGRGERSYPHTTAYVVHGLHVARENDVAIVPGVFDRGIAWLERYQKKEVKKIENGRKKTPKRPWKSHADNLDAFVFMVLVEAGKSNDKMHDFLYEDRSHLSIYAKSMYGIALHKLEDKEKLAMIMRNIEQHLVEDDENQTAYLDMPGHHGYWWHWYGSEYEAHAYYLKLLSRVEPGSKRSSRLVKYLLNNRKHATYWNSTRDTALCIEAFAEYIRNSGEDQPDMTVEILLDGRKVKEVDINAENLFTYDNKLVLTGKAITSGEHTVEVRRKGTGPLYFNAYLSNFTLEDHITKAGLEIKVERAYYKLVAVDKKIKVAGSRGQALDQKVEKYKRIPLKNLDTVKSGDLIEIELVVESKNDYEYILFEDMKAAGFEPYQVRSGYIHTGLRAYMELRDERVAIFVRTLARGRHSVSYRMRAEIPGRFSALPTRAYAMYAPELKGNSDEIRINVVD